MHWKKIELLKQAVKKGCSIQRLQEMLAEMLADHCDETPDGPAIKEEIYKALDETLSGQENEVIADLAINLAIQQDLFNQPLDTEKLLIKAASHGRIKQIDTIAKHIKPENLTYLGAVVVGNFERVRQYIEEGVDINKCRDNYFHLNAMHFSTICGHTDITRLLIQSGMSAMRATDYAVDYRWDQKGHASDEQVYLLKDTTKLKQLVKFEDASVAELAANQLFNKKPKIRKIATQYLQEHPSLAIPAILNTKNGDMDFVRQLAAANPELAEKLLTDLPQEDGRKLHAIMDQRSGIRDEASPEDHPAILITPRWKYQKRRPKINISKTLSLTMLPYTEDIAWEEDLDRMFYDVVNPYLPGKAWWHFWSDVNLSIIFDFILIFNPEKAVTIGEGKPVHEYKEKITQWIGKSDDLAKELKVAYLKITLYHLGPVAIPLMIKLFEKKSVHIAAALENVNSPRVAVTMAQALSKRGSRRSAYVWFKQFPEAAAVGLIPAVFGKDEKLKTMSTQALRTVIESGQEEVVRDVAGRYGQDVVKAMQSLFGWNALDDFPARVPAMPDFWNPAGLPRPILSVCDKTLSMDAMQHLGEMLAFSSPGSPYAGLRQVKDACVPQSLAAFAWELFISWLRAGADPKADWVMTALGYFGDNECAEELCEYITNWPSDGAAKRAVRGIDVLTEIGTDRALWKLSQLEHHSRYKSIKNAAGAAIEQISLERGLTRDELTDRIIPDLGFGRDASMVFDYGPRQYTVGFDQAFKPYIKDADGKKLRALPRAKNDDDSYKAGQAASTWKHLKKDMAVISKERTLHLELAMAGRRFWAGKVFSGLFLDHPILRLYVRGLVWGLYDSSKYLKSTFRLDSDGKLVKASGHEFEMAESMAVGIVHPKEVSETEWAHWREVFALDKIVQPFSQIDRPVFAPFPDEIKTGKISRANETISSFGRLKAFEKRGWHRPPGPASFMNNDAWIYCKAFPGGYLLKFEIAPYYDDEESATPTRVYLGNANLENQDVSRVHPVMFSEMIHDIMYMAGKLKNKEAKVALPAPKNKSG